jgi:Ca-activated chloride channel homolog
MNLALFHFIRPYWLLAFIPLTVLTVLILRHKLQRGNWANVCDAQLLPYILQQKPVNQSRFPIISINVIAAVLTILTLAGPTWERVPSPAFRNDSGLVIALDLSRSMKAGDIKPSRLERARFKIRDILNQRKDGQTALVVYTDDAFTVTPLTNDNATIASQLEALTPEIMPSTGSNTVIAVQKSVELFKQAGLQKGQILLVTDAVNSEESSAVLATLEDYQLSVLAVGTEQGAPISLPDGGFLKDNSGAIVIPKLPATTLQKLANEGRGIYQLISDNDSDIKALLAAVDKSVQKTGDNNEQNNMLLEKWDEKGVWLLLLVLPLAALSFRRGLLILAFMLILPLPKNSYALEWRDLWQTKDQQGQQAFQQGQFDKAAKLFEDPAWQAAAQYKANELDTKQLKTPTTATGFYNQGNVFARAGFAEKEIKRKKQNFENAIKSYKQSLDLESNNSDAKYNKKLVETELKKLEQEQQEEKKQSDKNQQKSDNQNQQKQDNQNSKEHKESQGDKNNKQNSENKPGNQQQKSQSGENTAQNKPEQNQQPSQPNQATQKPQDLKNQQQPAAQAKKQQNEQPKQKAQPIEPAQPKQDEKNQANEQWLKRIPDDPAGLLRRKFKYQYNQRQRQATSGQSW